MRRSLLLAAIAGLAAASATPGFETIPEPTRPKVEYQPGERRYRNVKKSYSRVLAGRLREKAGRRG